jgi:transcriptional regulator with XRE-family HTH domain
MTDTSKQPPGAGLAEKGLRRRIGARIAALRERREWSQEELARRIGVGRTRLGKWETGEHAPPIPQLLALKAAFGVSLDELVEGSGEETAPAISAGERAGVEKAIEILAQWLRQTAAGRKDEPEGDQP